MEFGLDISTGKRLAAEKGLQAICEMCAGPLVAKCGKIMIHHWAHNASPCTDTWKEPESPWHREWKSNFPIEWRERVLIDQETGEKHRADIFVPHKGLCIEFQHSQISVDNIELREKFYKKLIWVVNAENQSFSSGSIQKLIDIIKSDKELYCKKELKINDLYYLDSRQIEELRNLQQLLISKINLLNYKKYVENIVQAFQLMQNAVVESHSPHENYHCIIKSSVLLLELLEPIFEKAIDSVNNTLKEKGDLYHYTLSSKRWKYAKMPIFVHHKDYLYLLKSGNVCKLVSKQDFCSKYSSSEYK
jgi:competence CoiA-like predicted nuclease